MLSRTTKILLVILVALGGALFVYLRMASAPMAEPPPDAYPPGRWRRLPTRGPTAAGDLERVLSLPYLQGKIEAEGAAGVVRYEPELAQPGVNLYCSGHAPEAFLMAMNGEMLHRWRVPFERAFPESEPDTGSLYLRRVALLPEGDLLVLFQGWGIARVDRHSEIEWVRPLPAFNDFHVTRDGRILMLHKSSRLEPEHHPGEPILEDFVVELSSKGEEIQRWSLLRMFRESPYADLLASMGPGGDVLHSNTVTLLEDSPFDSGIFLPHRVLVSLREVDTIGVVDPSSGAVVWAARGSWRRQHEPVLLPSGRILLFDNLGSADGNARVIEIDPASAEIRWSWGDAPDQRLFSPEGGSVARLANGNTLIIASESGRALEVTADGTVAWEFLSPHRAGPRRELVAALWDVGRIDAARLGWLGDDT